MGAVTHQPTSGNAKNSTNPLAIATMRRRALDTGPAYAVDLVGDDATTHRSDGGLRTITRRRRGRRLGDLVKGVNDLLAPPHHVPRRHIGLADDGVEALALSPTVNGVHQAPM